VRESNIFCWEQRRIPHPSGGFAGNRLAGTRTHFLVGGLTRSTGAKTIVPYYPLNYVWNNYRRAEQEGDFGTARTVQGQPATVCAIRYAMETTCSQGPSRDSGVPNTGDAGIKNTLTFMAKNKITSAVVQVLIPMSIAVVPLTTEAFVR
jgi:hypothetical protein